MESGCNFGDKCSFAHRQVASQPSKKPKKDGDKSAVAMLKDARQLGCAFQDTERPESSSIVRTNSTSTIHKSCSASCKHPRRQRSVARKKQVEPRQQRSPYALKFGDRPQEETERQERCALGNAWRLAKKILKLKEKDKTTFFSPTNEWSPSAPSVMKPEEREFVVDSGASMHMLSRKDLNSAE